MPRSFAITVSPDSAQISAGKSGKFVFTITNMLRTAETLRIRLVPTAPAASSWLQPPPEEECALQPQGTRQFTVTVAPPAGTRAGTYSFRLDAISVSDPDERFAEGPAVAFRVEESAAPRRGFPWWILAVAGVFLLTVAGLTWYLLRSPALPGLNQRCDDACAAGLVCAGDPPTCLGDLHFAPCEDPGDCAPGLGCGQVEAGAPGRCLGAAGFSGCQDETACLPGLTCTDNTCQEAPTVPEIAFDAPTPAWIGVSSWGPGRLDVFVRGIDRAVWHRGYEGGWSDWESLGGTVLAGPAAVSPAPGRIHVFARGPAGDLTHLEYNGSWQPWQSLGGGALGSAPAAAAWPGQLNLFTRGLDGALWSRVYSGGWQEWTRLDGLLGSGPAAAAWEPGRLDVFARGMDNALWHKWFSAGSWSGWESLGGLLTSGPGVTAWGPGRLDIFVRGADNALWHKWYDGGWSEWEQLGGVLSSDPAVVAWGPGRLDIFARGLDNALWHKWYDGGWSDWENLGGVIQ